MSQQGWSVRDVADRSADAPSGPIGHATVATYRNGKHAVVPPIRVLRSLSWALGIPLATLQRAAGIRESLGEWVPPPEADQMTAAQRDLVTTLIKMLVAYPERSPDRDPEPNRASSTDGSDTGEVVAISGARTGAAERARREEWEQSQTEDPQANGQSWEMA